MIREAVVEDARRIAEIEVEGSRFAYKNIVSEESLYNDFTVENIQHKKPVLSRNDRPQIDIKV